MSSFTTQHRICPEANPALFTLIVYADNFEAYNYCLASIRTIIKKLPCKVLVVSLEEAQSGLFERSRIASLADGEEIANESIRNSLFIKASLDQLHRVSFAFLPEIIPDLPVYMLFQGPPSKKEELFEMLMPYVTKIIFSSSQIENYPLFTKEILQSKYIDKYIDLQLIQMRPWQEAILQIFEEEQKKQILYNIKTLRICYSKQSIAPLHTPFAKMQALYFQTWIAKWLGWSLCSIKEENSSGRISLSYLKGSQSIHVDIGPYYNQFLDDGTISSIELKSLHEIDYLAHYEQDDRHITVHSSSRDRCDMPFTLFSKTFQKGALLINALLQKYSDIFQYKTIAQEIATIENIDKK